MLFRSHVAMTEQSKLIIDDFVYDPDAKKGSLSMEVAAGTVRYASGKIAKNNRRNRSEERRVGKECRSRGSPYD